MGEYNVNLPLASLNYIHGICLFVCFFNIGITAAGSGDLKAHIRSTLDTDGAFCPYAAFTLSVFLSILTDKDET